MQKKVFVQKNMRSPGKRPQVRVLLWAALALILLVVITPFVVHHSKSRDASKPSSDKGMLVKGIPKPPAPMAEDLSTSEPSTAKPTDEAATSLASVTGTAASPPAGVPGAEKPAAAPEGHLLAPRTGYDAQQVREPARPVQPASGESSTVSGQAPPVAGGAVVPTQEGESKGGTAVPSAPPPQVKEQVASVAPAPAARAPQVGQPRAEPSASRPPAAGKTLYAVQVGSFKEKKNAEDMQRNLQKKGYSVIITPSVHPQLGQLYVVQLQPVEDIGKASTLMEQIRQEQSVKPVLKKVTRAN